jgi:hypothetical protein
VVDCWSEKVRVLLKTFDVCWIHCTMNVEAKTQMRI